MINVSGGLFCRYCESYHCCQKTLVGTRAPSVSIGLPQLFPYHNVVLVGDFVGE